MENEIIVNQNEWTNVSSIIKTEGSRMWATRSPMLADNQRKAYFARLITNIANNDKLKDSLNSRQGLYSVYECMSKAIQLGLNIGGTRPQAQIVPFKGKATLVPTSDGLRWAVISKPDPIFKDVITRVVYEGENFSIDYATDKIIHNYDGIEKLGQWRGITTELINFEGKNYVYYISRAQVEKIRDTYSKSYQAFKNGKISSSPWVDSPEEMAKKTHIKQVLKPYVSEKEALAALYEIDNDNSLNQEQYNSTPTSDRMANKMDNILKKEDAAPVEEAEVIQDIEDIESPEPEQPKKEDDQLKKVTKGDVF